MSRKNQKLSQGITNPKYTGISELLATENGLVNYSRSIVKKFYKKMNLDPSSKICEFGAGTGFLAEIFRSEYHIEPECIELDPNLISLIRSKQLTCFQFLNESSQMFDAIYTSNVLEHIENDSAMLEELFESLIPGGVLGIYVPAHPILYSIMDKEIGHVRRYTRSELKSKVLTAGFTIQSISYDEFVGFFASAFVKIVGYKNRAKLGSKNSLVFYDTIIYPISRVFDFIGFRYLVGKNLILIATKPSLSSSIVK
jgi:SAM-dependent methyltransferase